ncbi:plasmid stabilization protein [Serratia sp. S1B]|nr:plasmid stabilization protein [Serratia sp. S1B]
MAPFEVVLTRDAEDDLEEIYDYIAEHDGLERADYVLDQLLEVSRSLSSLPAKESVPRELQSLGIREYRQTFFKPYRVIYRVVGQQVVIFVIVDGRRDMQLLLTRRLLGR